MFRPFHANFAQMQVVNLNLIITLPKTFSEVASSTLDVYRPVKRIRGCVADQSWLLSIRLRHSKAQYKVR